MKYWNTESLEIGSTLLIELGRLQLWLHIESFEWQTAFNHDSQVPLAYLCSTLPEKPTEKEWTRWALPSNSKKINLNPLLPDRPLVVRPEFIMKIPAGVIAEFHVGIPVWINILSEKDSKIFEVPSEILSNTWFGTMETGELCYALKSSILAASEPLKPFLHKAICPISITNESEDDLELQRICIQLKHLSLYQGQDRLWTNKVKITYMGEEQISNVKMDNKAPGPKSDFDLLTEPREKISGSFVKKTFSSIREMAGI